MKNRPTITQRINTLRDMAFSKTSWNGYTQEDAQFLFDQYDDVVWRNRNQRESLHKEHQDNKRWREKYNELCDLHDKFDDILSKP